MKSFLLQFFTWWNGQTLGTRFFTWRKGEKVGDDAEGNSYYQHDERRWVIYNGDAEPSRIPSGWHGWMHHRTNTPPPKENYAKRDWELAHQANLTGSAGAYRPKGSLANQTKRPDIADGYDAWTP